MEDSRTHDLTGLRAEGVSKSVRHEKDVSKLSASLHYWTPGRRWVEGVVLKLLDRERLYVVCEMS